MSTIHYSRSVLVNNTACETAAGRKGQITNELAQVTCNRCIKSLNLEVAPETACDKCGYSTASIRHTDAHNY